MWVTVEKTPLPSCDLASSSSQGIAFFGFGASARAAAAAPTALPS
jgi:hypothetical protein